ncbi:MAG: gamma-glutamylcyclotransferase family protein [Terriglobia bacterium]
MENRDQLLWVFVYGSNLCTGKMLGALGGTWKKVVRANAKGFEVVFNKNSTKWGAAANIVPHPRKTCKGVVYRITERQFKKLKGTEDGYEVMCVEVQTETEERIAARTFVARRDSITNRSRPKRVYLDFIWHGGLEQGLPRRYLRELIRKGRGRIPES